MEEAPETGSRDHTSIAPWHSSIVSRWELPRWWPGPILLGRTHSIAYIPAAHTSWQHGAPVSPGIPGTTLWHSNPAPAQHPSSRRLLVQIPLYPSYPQYKTPHGTAIGTLPVFPSTPLMPREYVPATPAGTTAGRMGRNHGVHHVGRRGLPPWAKSGHCSKPPSHSGSKDDTGNNCWTSSHFSLEQYVQAFSSYESSYAFCTALPITTL